jgi:hypothetical protein
MWLVSSPASFSQNNERRTEDATAEIALLKRAVNEQDRRIADLEKAVSALQLRIVSSPQKTGTGDGEWLREQPKDSIAPVSEATMAPWKSLAVWSRLKEGMSHAQVVAILGKPTSVKHIASSSFETLFYQGDVHGSASVTGTVVLNDDRVWEINTPVF